MFYLMAQKAARPPSSIRWPLPPMILLPPPETIQLELGEVRTTRRGAIHLRVGPCIDMENFPGSDIPTSARAEKLVLILFGIRYIETTKLYKDSPHAPASPRPACYHPPLLRFL